MGSEKDQLISEILQLKENISEESELISVEMEGIAEEIYERKESLLSEMSNTLTKKLDSYKSARTDIENRWLNSLSLYYSSDYSSSNGNVYDQKKSTKGNRPKVNIVRNKCKIAISKLEELTFGKNEKDYFIEPTDLQDLYKSQNDHTIISDPSGAPLPDPKTGQPTTMAAVAEKKIHSVLSSSEKMSSIIDDQLMEGDYAKAAKRAQKDKVILGTGIIKGPIVDRKVRHRYNSNGEKNKQIESDIIPSFHRVDPWLWFPDPEGAVVEDLTDAFELIPMSTKRLAGLIEHPLFFGEKIRQAIALGTSSTYEQGIDDKLAIFSDQRRLKNKYHVWCYSGPLSPNELKVFDCDVTSLEQDLEYVMGEVWMCNGIIIRVNTALIEGDNNVPYMVDVWEIDESSPFGISLPDTLSDHQRVAQKTWEMILDNSGLSVGPQVVVNKSAIKPANGLYDIEPLKVWYMTDAGERAADAMHFFSIPSNSGDLQAIHEMARTFADEESATPLAQQTADTTQAASTATGMAMLFSSANVLQKADSRSWGESITKIVVERLYHYNMQDPDIPPSAKGDYDIKVTPMSNIIGEQLESQDLEKLTNLALQSPFNAYVNHEELFRAGVANMHIDSNRFIKSREQVKIEEEERMNQPPPPDPEMEKIKLKAMELEIEKEKIGIDAERRKFEAQERVRQRDEELRIRMYEAQERQQQAIAQVLNSQRQQEIELIKLADAKETSVANLQKELGIAELQAETKKFIAGMTAQLELNKVQMKEMNK